LTGITVTISLLGEDEFVTKLPISLSSGASTPDVFMINQLGQALAAGWMAPISKFLDDKTLTDRSWYDEGDIFPGAVAFTTAKGTQWAVPVSAEAELIFARKDLVPHAPATYPALETAAAAAQKAGNMPGIVNRAIAAPSETPWPVGGFVFSYGGYYIDPNGRPAFDTPEVVEAVGVYTTLLRKWGPKGVASWGWNECDAAFAAGEVAMWCDSSSHAAQFTNPSTAKYAKENTLYSLPAHNGMVRPNLWYWTVGINKNSNLRGPAWLFVEWLTSPPTTLARAVATGTEPRASAWKSPALAKTIGAEAAHVVSTTLFGADPLPFALAWTNPNWDVVSTALAQGVSSIVSGQSSVTSAMAQVQKSALAAMK
jgi:multiple sugar transport system substrate-binding protein